MGYVDVFTYGRPKVGGTCTAEFADGLRANQEHFAEPPSCRFYASTPTAVASGTPTVVPFDSTDWDTDDMRNVGSPGPSSRLWTQTAGRYRYGVTVAFEANATGYRRLNYRINGGSAFTLVSQPAVAGGVSTVLTVMWSGLDGFYPLDVGDYVEVEAVHDAGTDLDVTGRQFTALWTSR